MLCNRPNEFGQFRKAINTDSMPFKSQVHIEGPLGWNPPARLLPKVSRKKATNGVLLKHRLFLKDLEKKKFEERIQMKKIMQEGEAKEKLIREQSKL